MPAKYRRPIGRSPKNDPQRNRLYRMESEAIGGSARAQLTDEEALKAARAVCRAYGAPPIRITYKVMKWTGMCWSDGRIELNPKKKYGRSLLTLLHELAHHVHNHLAPGNTAHQSHGPEYLACYISIFDVARVIPAAAMRAIFDSYKLKYIDPGDSPSLSVLKQRISTTRA